MTTPDTVEEQPQLRRVMGPGLLLLFIVGDILGTGVYALTGDVAAEVGGAAWIPFLVAFLIATVTAFSYLELVTKYPQAAGAALYAHKAFGVQFVTFLVAFVVMCSGITSASTASRFFAANFNTAFDLGWGKVGIVIVALLFMAMLAAVNFRGVGESVKLNVGLTIIEITGLLLVIMVGLWAFTGGGADVDFSRVVAFDTATDKNAFMAVTAATSLAFFAMVGFEDSVNMAEETKDPVRVFPKALLTGLSIAGFVYVVVAIVAVALVPIGTLESSDTPLVEVVKAGAPNLPIEDILPFISMFAVSNTALINMLMASRLIYGMARQRVLPPVLGAVHPKRHTPWVAILFTTLIAFGLIFYVTAFANSSAISVLGGTTSLLLLAVFALVNVAVLVLRRDVQAAAGISRPRPCCR
jgi:basic amino acid/polyamine antiporter, APA family